MQKELQLIVSPEVAWDLEKLLRFVSREKRIDAKKIRHLEILKRSIDARQKKIRVNLKVKLYLDESFRPKPPQLPPYQQVDKSPALLIIGAGPAGLFAALKAIELGYKPIVIERGKDVQKRRRDLAAIHKEHLVNPDSNYCFGEGGAGTYSDGKLYTRSKKRGDVRRILQTLIGFGAHPDIAVNAHPHIGTNKLPRIISSMREKILACGGEIHFETRMNNLLIKNNKVKGVSTLDGKTFEAHAVVLATGHSARDIFELLHKKGILIEAKPFALGVRVEHPQSLIDSIQYHCTDRGAYLPPAPYSIVRQVAGRGVYSFCMCPGGVIAPCATAPGEVVTNGWSPSRRNLKTANSGIVVALELEDFKAFKKHGPLMGLEFQKALEKKAWAMAGETQRVPGQKLVDFTEKKLSSALPKTSYQPGLTSVEMSELLPPFIFKTLQQGFKEFDRSMRGYLTNEAVVHAPESRTSSPVRIPRDRESLEHIEIEGLYPCGEGAGYAGGIISAAIDGEKCAEKAVAKLKAMIKLL